MDTKLVEKLHLKLEPVGIFFGNISTKCDMEALPDRRNCVIPFLLSAAKGKVVSLNEETCNCAGGAVGACFGDGFSRLNPNIHIMLSQGMGENAPEGAPPMMKEGERFFCNPEIAMKWRENLPYSDKAYPRIVFAPYSRWEEAGIPDLVLVFANQDQLSAIITMQEFFNGKRINTIVPFGAACQSIMYAAEQMEKEEPCAVLGLFDISQRNNAIKDYLSITLTYSMWENMSKDLDKSCLSSDSWKNIEKRL